MNRRTFVTGGAAATAATLATATLAEPATGCGPCEAGFLEFRRRNEVLNTTAVDACTSEQIAWLDAPAWEALAGEPRGDREWAALVLLIFDHKVSDAATDVFLAKARRFLDVEGA